MGVATFDDPRGGGSRMQISRMKRARGPWTRCCRDFLRLARVDDLLCRLGGLMMRTSPKATLWTAGIMSSGFLSRKLGLPGFTAVEALAAPVVVGAGLLGLGVLMRFAPGVLSGRWTTVAEASDLNLMEDYRKSQAREHLDRLWDRVFWYESEIRYSSAERQAERDEIWELKEYVKQRIQGWDSAILERLEIGGERDIDESVLAVLSERPLRHNMEKSRDGFLLSALYALRHPVAQCSQSYDIGFRLNFYEDFCDGAYFDRSDVKLFEQYAGHPLLTDVREAVGFGRLDSLRQVPKKAVAGLWFFLVTRKIATGAGRAVRLLNRTYKTDAFNSQVLLWPGEENAGCLDAYPGARDDVLALRTSLVRAALGRDFPTASAVLDRMFLPCFEFATHLRARYDPEYCNGSLSYACEDTGRNVKNTLIGDLEERGYRPETIARARRYAEKVQADQAAFVAFLTVSGRPEWTGDREALRAARIAFHVNRNGMQEAFLERRAAEGSAIEREIERAVADRAVYTDRLVGLRVHQQLSMFQLDGYKDLAGKLAYAQ